nr:fatty acyl-AMP ligase [Nocardia bovistercoris]
MARTRPDDPAFTALRYRGAACSPHTLSYARLHGAASALARRLCAESQVGDRVAILCEQGLDYVIAFLACLYSGRVAVPLPQVTGARSTERIDSALADAGPRLLLVSAADSVTADALAGHASAILSPDPDAHAERPDIETTDLAYLQYTSGSTKSPAGVRITHGNLIAGLTQLHAAVPVGDRPIVTWLPFFHDMGLVLGLSLPLFRGVHGVTLSPQDFVKRPIRWPRACSDYRAGITASPNFGLSLVVSGTSEQERAGLDLSGLDAILNGAEHVRADALNDFTHTFTPHGFRHRAHTPGYGLAEATLAVTIADLEADPVTRRFDRTALNAGEAVPADTGITLVACGFPVGQRVAVVDPERRVELPEGAVGEIWVSGPNVGAGYHGNPSASADTFGAVLTGDDGHWLRTGDLGFRHETGLYVTGRRKDLIVVDGRNHYPADIEATAVAAGAHLRAGYLTAFGHDDGVRESLVIVAELHNADEAADAAAIAVCVRSAVADVHAVMPESVVMVAPGAIPRTSSGKVRRADCRALFDAGRLPALATAGKRPLAAPD